MLCIAMHANVNILTPNESASGQPAFQKFSSRYTASDSRLAFHLLGKHLLRSDSINEKYTQYDK